ncbi:MAG: sel1 repeat family protein [Prevotella sp.]|nr:sel1 repeat family protein [Prevotella sp.]
MRKILITLSCMLLCMAMNMHAQSMSMAKYYYEQGKYLEAAKQLRPLADGGNAEAQAMAARMFFEGKGVQKNDAQGEKYATMAADQCNENAIFLLVVHYRSTNPQKYFQTCKNYCDKFPYLAKKDLGLNLAGCYLEGKGTEKNEQLGYDVLESNELLEGTTYYGPFLQYKARQAGKDNLEDYADWLFANGQQTKFNKVCQYIKTHQRGVMAYYEKRANEGNAFACAMLANNLYDNGEIERARQYHRRSIQGGSTYGRSLTEKINFTPESFDINVKFDRLVTFVKVEHRYDRTILHGLYKGDTSSSWKEFAQEAYLVSDNNSPKYTMTSTSKRIYGNSYGRPVAFTLEFKPIPKNWKWLDFCYENRSYMTITK